MTGMEEAAAAALLLRLGASLGAAWLAGRAADGLSKGQTYNNSTAQDSQQSPAEQAQNADNGTQSLSPGDPKPPCQDCGNDDREEKKPKKRRISDDELKGRSYEDAENYLDKELRDNADWTKDVLRDGNGVRYFDGRGNSVQLNQGYLEGLKGGGGDGLHLEPYAKISQGTITRIPLRR